MSEDKLTGNVVVCVMIDGTATAVVEIDTPYLSGTVDVIIGNVPVVEILFKRRQQWSVEVHAVVARCAR